MYTQTPPSMATRFSERKRVVRDDDDDDYEISEHINGPPLKINVKLRSAERSAFNSVQNDHNVQNDNYLTPKTESSDKTQMGKRKTFEFGMNQSIHQSFALFNSILMLYNNSRNN